MICSHFMPERKRGQRAALSALEELTGRRVAGWSAAPSWAARRFLFVPNVYRPAFEEGERPPGFRARRARVGYELGSELIGCSLWEVPPGEAAYPTTSTSPMRRS